MRLFPLVCTLLIACATGTGEASHGDAPPRPAAQAPAAVQPQAAAAKAAPARVVLMPPGQEPVTVLVEVVQRPEDRQRGLMYRQALDENAGMLFLFEGPREQSFWMRNTYIPLDMIFIRSDMAILGIVENAEPLTDDSRRVPGLSQYVLEVNAGFARKHGLGAGMMVRFEGVDALATR